MIEMSDLETGRSRFQKIVVLLVKLLTRLLNISKTMQELLLIGIHAGVLVNDGFEFDNLPGFQGAYRFVPGFQLRQNGYPHCRGHISSPELLNPGRGGTEFLPSIESP